MLSYYASQADYEAHREPLKSLRVNLRYYRVDPLPRENPVDAVSKGLQSVCVGHAARLGRRCSCSAGDETGCIRGTGGVTKCAREHAVRLGRRCSSWAGDETGCIRRNMMCDKACEGAEEAALQQLGL